MAGSTQILTDTFYVKKDTITPIITDNQTGDDVWRSTDTTTYNVDFNDTGGSLLSYFETRVSTNPGGNPYV
ncbi:unnamed protein product, partial [marine sediment metagenome]